MSESGGSCTAGKARGVRPFSLSLSLPVSLSLSLSLSLAPIANPAATSATGQVSPSQSGIQLSSLSGIPVALAGITGQSCTGMPARDQADSDFDLLRYLAIAGDSFRLRRSRPDSDRVSPTRIESVRLGLLLAVRPQHRPPPPAPSPARPPIMIRRRRLLLSTRRGPRRRLFPARRGRRRGRAPLAAGPGHIRVTGV